MTKIKIKNVAKIFGPNPAQFINQEILSRTDIQKVKGHTLGVHGVNLEIQEGEFFVIMGLSGSGKSTLIRHLNGLIAPSRGEVWIDDILVSSLKNESLRNFRRRKISMVFQRFGLLPHKTVLENIALGLRLRGETKEQRNEKAHQWIERVGLQGFESHYPHQLSGGMQQRVGIARALCTETDILLMDEPFSALDPLIRAEMQEQVLSLKKEFNLTIILVTHDLDEAVKLADRMSIMRDGQIIQTGKPREIIESPADDYIREFVSKINPGR